VRRVGQGGRSEFLCARCGAIVAAPAAGDDGSYSGSCPECGFGFSGAILQAGGRSRFGLGHRREARRSSDPAPLAYATAAQELVHGLWRREMPHSRAVHPTFGSIDPTDGWGDVEVLVNGAKAAFKFLRQGDEWVALASLADESTVSIESRHADPSELGLIRLKDLSAYLDDDAFPWRREPN